MTFALLIFSSINAQTSSQKRLIYDFFELFDVKESIRQIHPSCDFRGVAITNISNNSVYFSVSFVDNTFWGSGNAFTCKLRLDIDYNGVFTTLAKVSCGNPGTMDCGAAITLVRRALFDDDDVSSSNRPAIQMQENLKAKRMSDFKGRELICARLFEIWYDRGYYRAY